MSVPYCSVADVRAVLHARDDYTDGDTEIARCIVSGDRMLRSWAKARGLTIPSVPVPEDISEASASLAAWMFKLHGDPPFDDKALYGLAETFFGLWADGADECYVGTV